jgi:hypothetical protein
MLILMAQPRLTNSLQPVSFGEVLSHKEGLLVRWDVARPAGVIDRSPGAYGPCPAEPKVTPNAFAATQAMTVLALAAQTSPRKRTPGPPLASAPMKMTPLASKVC